jgi:hypothetical protein
MFTKVAITFKSINPLFWVYNIEHGGLHYPMGYTEVVHDHHQNLVTFIEILTPDEVDEKLKDSNRRTRAAWREMPETALGRPNKVDYSAYAEMLGTVPDGGGVLYEIHQRLTVAEQQGLLNQASRRLGIKIATRRVAFDRLLVKRVTALREVNPHRHSRKSMRIRKDEEGAVITHVPDITPEQAAKNAKLVDELFGKVV